MHQVLYNKYRPQTFDDVIGQSAITQTLKNQIVDGTFAHAYLFTGTRGTGKTTCARLFARAVNCEHSQDGEPCGECEICRGFIEHGISDIIEIDAATNNGVENVRQIRDSVEFRPVIARYKVYVIDEVHMLSDSAYNALLKTIEEPPSYVIFILATTEINKVPATIISRCQRFDFRRVRTVDIADRIRYIVKCEQKQMDNESIDLVAELGDGSVRDALSILEKVIDLADGEAVRAVLGVIGSDTIYDLLRSIAKSDLEGIYTAVDHLYNGAKDLSVLCSELLSYYRAMLVIKSVQDYNKILNKSEQECQVLKKIAEQYSTERILYAMDNLQQVYQALPKSPNKRSDVELCLLKIVLPDFRENFYTKEVKIDKTKKSTDVAIENKADIPKAEELFDSPLEKKEYNEFLSWNDVCQLVTEEDRFLGLTLKNSCSAVYKDNQIIVVCPDDETTSDICTTQTVTILKNALSKMRKAGYEVTIKSGRKSDYIGTTDTYDNIEKNPMFEFDE